MIALQTQLAFLPSPNTPAQAQYCLQWTGSSHINHHSRDYFSDRDTFHSDLGTPSVEIPQVNLIAEAS